MRQSEFLTPQPDEYIGGRGVDGQILGADAPGVSDANGGLVKLFIKAWVVGMLSQCCIASAGASGKGGISPSAPPVKCELQLSTWCIASGAYEVSRKLADDSIHESFLYTQRSFFLQSRLVVLEPNGCKQCLSNTMKKKKWHFS